MRINMYLSDTQLNLSATSEDGVMDDTSLELKDLAAALAPHMSRSAQTEVPAAATQAPVADPDRLEDGLEAACDLQNWIELNASDDLFERIPMEMWNRITQAVSQARARRREKNRNPVETIDLPAIRTRLDAIATMDLTGPTAALAALSAAEQDIRSLLAEQERLGAAIASLSRERDDARSEAAEYKRQALYHNGKHGEMLEKYRAARSEALREAAAVVRREKEVPDTAENSGGATVVVDHFTSMDEAADAVLALIDKPQVTLS